MAISSAMQGSDRARRIADWSGSYDWRPTLLRAGADPFELPRPIGSLRLKDGWDFAQFKVPLKSGDLLAGHSRAGIELTITGELLVPDDEGSEEGPTFLAGLAALEELRAALDVGAAADKFALGLAHDAESGDWHHFRGGSPVRCDCDLSRREVFAYAVTLHFEDPVLHVGPYPPE